MMLNAKQYNNNSVQLLLIDSVYIIWFSFLQGYPDHARLMLATQALVQRMLDSKFSPILPVIFSFRVIFLDSTQYFVDVQFRQGNRSLGMQLCTQYFHIVQPLGSSLVVLWPCGETVCAALYLLWCSGGTVSRAEPKVCPYTVHIFMEQLLHFFDNL